MPQNYPNPDVSSKEKAGLPWLRQYAKAALEEANKSCATMFYGARQRYEELWDYALGRQSNAKYKKVMNVGEQDNQSWLAIDWSVRPVANKFIDVAISKLQQRDFHIVATPIDPLAKDEADKYFADQKAKLLMREAAQRTGDPEIANSPVLQADPGEPEDGEELEMQMQFGFKHNLAMEAEQGIELVLYQNDIVEKRRQVLRQGFVTGVAGYKESMDERGKITVRDVVPKNIVISYCTKPDFSDAVHVGELVDVPLMELCGAFSKEEMKIIAENAVGKQGNPGSMPANTQYNNGYDGFKVQVLDLELLSEDTDVYKQRVDERGNLRIHKDKFSKKYDDRKINYNGEEQPKYITKKKINVYKVKWIVGTDFCYDFGLATNMKREPKPSLMADTSLSYHLYAYNFDSMRAQGIMERLVPEIDDYHLTIYKLQNLMNRMMPAGWAIDLDALEGVAIGKGGANMKPLDILDMFAQSGNFVYRGSNVYTNNPNAKPIESVQNPAGAELVVLANQLAAILQRMRDVTGLNEVTDGSTPSDRMGNGLAAMVSQSTNNALYPLVHADKSLLERLAKAVILRLQIAVKQGNIEGILPALGMGTVKYLKVSDGIAPHVWGIMIQDKATEEEKAMLMQDLNLKDSQGLIDPEIKVMAMSIHNVKQLGQYIAHKVNKARKQQQEMEQRNIELNGQTQMQSAQATSQAKMQELQMEWQLRTQFMLAEKAEEKEIVAMKLQGAHAGNMLKHETALVGQTMAQDHEKDMAPQQSGGGGGADLNGNGIPDALEEGMLAEQEGGEQPMEGEMPEEMMEGQEMPMS